LPRRCTACTPFAASALPSIVSASWNAENTSHFSPGAVTRPRTMRRTHASSLVSHAPFSLT